MKKPRFTLLLLAAILMSNMGCAAFRPKTASEPPTRRVTTTVIQTGSNIGRRMEVADSSEAGTANEEAKPKRGAAAKKKKSAEEVDETITRGGFR